MDFLELLREKREQAEAEKQKAAEALAEAYQKDRENAHRLRDEKINFELEQKKAELTAKHQDATERQETERAKYKDILRGLFPGRDQ